MFCVFRLVTAVVALAVVNASWFCPVGWSLYEPETKCFKVVKRTEIKSFTSFEVTCKGLDAQLASICSLQEHYYVASVISQGGRNASAWIGLNSGASKPWAWSDGNTCAFRFFRSEPKPNAEGCGAAKKRCAHLDASVPGLAWKDASCCEKAVPAAVCQKKATPIACGVIPSGGKCSLIPEAVQLRNGKSLFTQSFKAAVQTWPEEEQKSIQPTVHEIEAIIEAGPDDVNATVIRVYDALQGVDQSLRKKYELAGITWGSVRDLLRCVPEYYGKQFLGKLPGHRVRGSPEGIQRVRKLTGK
ncbi:C-type lectin protein [Aphelenchoides avenae]|nr:C-type lectin protein [Aphelenchus avenae]